VRTFDEAAEPDDCLPARGRHDKEGRQRALVSAAIATFAERGFEAATTREVAERAGCSEGLIHRYFGGKQGLLLAALEQKADTALTALAQPQSTDLEEDLRIYLVNTVERMGRERDSMRVTVSRSIVDAQTGGEVGRLFCGAQAAALVERLETHRAAGRIAADADLPAIVLAVLGVGFVNGFFAQAVFNLDRDQILATAHEAARVIARGLAPAQRQGAADAAND
jgi:AcrR family transcriptional regulator